jgi:hypothetical protein
MTALVRSSAVSRLAALLPPAIAVSAATLVGVALAVRPRLVLLLVICLAAAAWVAFCAVRTRAAFGLAVASAAFVPYYASPALGPVLLEPTALALLLLAAVLVVARHEGRTARALTLIDVAVLAFAASLALSVAFSARSPGELLRMALLWFAPYLAARLASARHGAGEALPRALAFAALALLPLVVAESLTGSTPFWHLAVGGHDAAVWLPGLSRFGDHRAEAAFGHPIALGMFLATASLLAIWLALRASRAGVRAAWLAASVALIAIQAFTLSRTGWLAFAVGLAAVALVRPRRLLQGRVVAVLTAVGLGLAFLPQAAPVRQLIVGTFARVAGTEVASAGDYRVGLLHQALRAGTLRPWGNRDSAFSGSIDNAYIQLADHWGFVAAIAFALVVLTVAWELVRRLRDGVGLWVSAACLGNLVALTTVALITQQQILVWVLIGACAGLVAAARKQAA